MQPTIEQLYGDYYVACTVQVKGWEAPDEIFLTRSLARHPEDVEIEEAYAIRLDGVVVDITFELLKDMDAAQICWEKLACEVWDAQRA